MRGRRRFSDCARGLQDIIRGVLRLGGCVDQELAIVAKLAEPAGQVCGLILDDCGLTVSVLSCSRRQPPAQSVIHLGH